MVLYSSDWTKTDFSFILLTVNLFRHPTFIVQGLYFKTPICYFCFLDCYLFKMSTRNEGHPVNRVLFVIMLEFVPFKYHNCNH